MSTYSFRLQDSYLNLEGHSKSKGVNFKLRPPKDWKVEDGVRPNIIKKFVFSTNNFLMMVIDNDTFYSRPTIKEVFAEEAVVKEIVTEILSEFESPMLLHHSIQSIDNYPSIHFRAIGKLSRVDIEKNVLMAFWYVYYEDKIIMFQALGFNPAEFKALMPLYRQIMNSVVFGDQY